MHQPGSSLFVCAGLLAVTLLLPSPSAANWPTDPTVNVPLCTATGRQTYARTVPDGAGGAIAAWPDYRNGNWDIYAQRVSAGGTIQWETYGVALCTAAGDQVAPSVVPDGAGGAIVTWSSGSRIYAQRISAAGTIQWAVDGVALCTAAGAQVNPTSTSDGAGGAIVAWQDNRSGGYTIYAQRISAAGSVQWTTGGVPLCPAAHDRLFPGIASDGAGGAIVVWWDDFSGYYDLFAQRVSAAGAVQWGTFGVAVCTAANAQINPSIAADGTGGSVLAWEDFRSGVWRIYAQRISAAGVAQWTADGVAVCATAGSQSGPGVIPDGTGRAIVTWLGGGGIHAQCLSAAGALQWPADGVALTSVGGSYSLAPDGAGGAIAAWSGSSDIYAQRISAAGAVLWTAGGVAVCTANGAQANPNLSPDGANGAIVTWWDGRLNGNAGIYSQRVLAGGQLGGGVPVPALASLVSVDLAADRISLTWFAGGSGINVATVYRSFGGGEWTRIGQATVDGTGYLRYVDRVDAPGTSVGYRLGILDAGAEGFYGETWVDLPALKFALAGARPNPTQGGALTVRFSLPSAAPAQLELLDVSGRRVAGWEVGSSGAGWHTLDLGEGRRLAPGLYLVRLTQGTNRRTTRVAVTR